MHTIGFAGTAKNTGKTTTCLKVMEEGRAKRMRIALTSIGYDGERVDNVTGLPKPRYFLKPGEWIATAEKCLPSGTARWHVHFDTSIQTVLGTVLIAEVIEPGWVVLAGPNRRSDLEQVLDQFALSGIELALVDGALNRLVPMIAVDGLVLSTGAAFDTDISIVARHARALSVLFSPGKNGNAGHYSRTCLSLIFQNGTQCMISGGSLLSQDGVEELARAIENPLAALCIPNACSPIRIRELIMQKKKFLLSTHFIFGNPLKLIASGDPCMWMELIEHHEIQVTYIDILPLYLVTVNPLYPRPIPGHTSYEAATIDKTHLLQSVKTAVKPLKTLDIHQDFEDLLPQLFPSHSKIKEK
jgi:molybdopterin-guanine dinucleotide biosynthesis protein